MGHSGGDLAIFPNTWGLNREDSVAGGQSHVEAALLLCGG